MATKQKKKDVDIVIEDDEWNGIENELSTSESSDEEEEEQGEGGDLGQDLRLRKEEALHGSQDALSLTKQMKQRNVKETREHGLWHRQNPADGLLGLRNRTQATSALKKDTENVDYSEDICLDGRKGKNGRHFSSGSDDRSVSPAGSTAPALVVTEDYDFVDEKMSSPRTSPRGRNEDPWHAKRAMASPGLPSIGGHSQFPDTSGRMSSPRNSRPGTPDVGALRPLKLGGGLSRSTENLPQGFISPTAPLQSPRIERRVPSPVCPKSPKVSLRMNIAPGSGTQLYSKDQLRAASPNMHKRSLSAGNPRR